MSEWVDAYLRKQKEYLERIKVIDYPKNPFLIDEKPNNPTPGQEHQPPQSTSNPQAET